MASLSSCRISHSPTTGAVGGAPKSAARRRSLTAAAPFDERLRRRASIGGRNHRVETSALPLADAVASASSSSASFEPRLSPAIALSAALAALPPIIYWYRVAGSVRKRLDEEEKEREQERERERARLEKLRRLRGSERATNDGTRPFSLHLSLARFSSFFTRLFFSQKKSRKACICKKKKENFLHKRKSFKKKQKITARAAAPPRSGWSSGTGQRPRP